MRIHRRGTWIDTRRELAQMAWAVLLIDAIAIGLGALASRPMGSFAFKVGVGLAVFVTVCFAFVIGGNLIVEAFVHRWLERDDPKGSRKRPTNAKEK
jgi:hypothetical protein